MLENRNANGHPAMEALTNGHPAPSLLGRLDQVLNLVEDHIKLAHLEYRYEKEQGWRRLGVGALIAFCGVSALLFVQAAVIIGLVHVGVPLYVLCLLFGVIYGVLGVYLYQQFCARDPRAGEPFQGSREELSRTMKWIHHLLS